MPFLAVFLISNFHIPIVSIQKGVLSFSLRLKSGRLNMENGQVGMSDVVVCKAKGMNGPSP
jgi:hypothetical protein